MKNTKRFLAFAGAVLLVCMYLATLIFALIDSPAANRLFQASVAATIIIPVLLYAYILIYRILNKKNEDHSEQQP